MSPTERAHRDDAALGQFCGVFVTMLVCWLALLFVGPAAWAQKQDEAEKPVTEVKPEQLELKPGDRFSPLSLVVNPAKLDGALSWTLETRRHRGEILAMALSNDGKLVATGGDDGTIRIWLLETGALVRALVGHTMYVSDLAWSPDGQTIASSGGYDCQLRLWDTANGKPLRVFQDFKEYTRQIAWSPDGGRLAVVGGSSGWIWIWNAKDEQGRMVAEIGKPVTNMDWSPTGNQLAFTVNDGAASIVDAVSGKVVQTFGDASTMHHRACWSPDGDKFLVTSADKSVVYKMPEGKPLATLPKQGWGPAWSPDSKSVYVMSTEGPRLWDLETDKVVQKIDRSGWPWFALNWKQSDRLVAVSKTTMVWWDPRVGKRSATYYIGGTEPPLWTGGHPILTGLNTATLQVWDAKTAELRHAYKGHTRGITSATWSPDGALLATSSWDKTIRLWDSESGQVRATLVDHKAPVFCLAWSPDGKTLASGGQDNMVRLWNSQGKLQSTLAGHTKPVTVVAWAARGNLLAAASEGSMVRLWDPQKSQPEREIRVSAELNALAFHPSGTVLAGGTADEMVRLWLVASGKPVMKDLRGDPGTALAANSLAWSPDGRFLLVGRENNSAQVWEWRTGRLSDVLYTRAAVKAVGFMSDGRYMFAGSDDRTVRFWDRVVGGLLGHVLDQGDHIILLGAKGHYRVTAGRSPDIVYVVQTQREQFTLRPAEFTERFGWKNDPAHVHLPGNKDQAHALPPSAIHPVDK